MDVVVRGPRRGPGLGGGHPGGHAVELGDDPNQVGLGGGVRGGQDALVGPERAVAVVEAVPVGVGLEHADSELAGEGLHPGLARTGPLTAELDHHVVVHDDVEGATADPVARLQYQHRTAGTFELGGRGQPPQARSDDHDLVGGASRGGTRRGRALGEVHGCGASDGTDPEPDAADQQATAAHPRGFGTGHVLAAFSGSSGGRRVHGVDRNGGPDSKSMPLTQALDRGLREQFRLVAAALDASRTRVRTGRGPWSTDDVGGPSVPRRRCTSIDDARTGVLHPIGQRHGPVHPVKGPRRAPTVPAPCQLYSTAGPVERSTRRPPRSELRAAPSTAAPSRETRRIAGILRTWDRTWLHLPGTVERRAHNDREWT